MFEVNQNYEVPFSLCLSMKQRQDTGDQIIRKRIFEYARRLYKIFTSGLNFRETTEVCKPFQNRIKNYIKMK